MKTIIRLVILAAITVIPFMTDAQMNVQRIENPEWFKHLIGKTLEEMEEMGFACDSLDWGRNNISPTWSMSFARYTLYEGEHEGKYHFYFEKDSEEPVFKAKPWKILYIVPEHKRTPVKNEEEDKEESITNPEWYKHLLGKTKAEVNIRCDSIRWLYNYPSSWTTFSDVYVVYRGNHVGVYTLFFNKQDNKPDSEAILSKIVTSDEVGLYIKQILSGEVRNEEYYLRQIDRGSNTSPSERIWLKFWEVKIKNDIKKDLKESK